MISITKEIEKELISAGYYPNVDDWMKAKVLVKYFNPIGTGTWLIVGGEQIDQDWILFGYAETGYDWEWGSVYLSELQQYKGVYGIGIEQDLYCFKKSVEELV